jgi:hypothetical protein
MPVTVKKCPDGVVPGAGDLHRWSSRRLAGWSSGVGDRSSSCRVCGGTGKVEVRKVGSRRMRCQSCGRTWRATR